MPLSQQPAALRLGALGMPPPHPYASSLVSTPSAASTTESKLDEAEADRMERRRKQCRISQRRYRDKKGSAEYNLQLDVNSLKATVMRLTEAKSLLQAKMLNYRHTLNGSLMKAVEQYMMMFRTGLHDPTAGVTARKCHDVQLNFLRAFMAEDVAFCSARGLDVLEEQWRRYTGYHDSFCMKLTHAEIMGTENCAVVKALSTVTVRINRHTLERLFPAALEDEELVQQLIGRHCTYPGCTIYVFNEMNQVTRQDLAMDFLSGLRELVGSSRRTLEILRSARIKESLFVDDDGEFEKNGHSRSARKRKQAPTSSDKDDGRHQSTEEEEMKQSREEKEKLSTRGQHNRRQDVARTRISSSSSSSTSATTRAAATGQSRFDLDYIMH
ncbi:TPA: hypothetical protein N0F65_006440 [Lagenidium giganteum]|uniref:BZIP domain-containing protein n=1 Tax=Lagenidium giganteum TaxID=4803 RepID=A0AAV2YZT4_9STRA|nr:TPA: hypothetical protein N0F65_006440 [Lagenidium giganteum]